MNNAEIVNDCFGLGGRSVGMMTGGIPFIWLVVLAGFAFVIWLIVRKQKPVTVSNDHASEELRMRFARGEINEDEYNQMSSLLKR